MDRYCFYCGEAVSREHRVLELRNTYCCDSDECQRRIREEIRAQAEEAEYRDRDPT